MQLKLVRNFCIKIYLAYYARKFSHFPHCLASALFGDVFEKFMSGTLRCRNHTCCSFARTWLDEVTWFSSRPLAPTLISFCYTLPRASELLEALLFAADHSGLVIITVSDTADQLIAKKIKCCATLSVDFCISCSCLHEVACEVWHCDSNCCYCAGF